MHIYNFIFKTLTLRWITIFKINIIRYNNNIKGSNTQYNYNIYELEKDHSCKFCYNFVFWNKLCKYFLRFLESSTKKKVLWSFFQDLIPLFFENAKHLTDTSTGMWTSVKNQYIWFWESRHSNSRPNWIT